MKKILIVDDDPGVVAMLQTVLKRAGYATVSAPNGETGAVTAQTEKPNLILLDLVMPGEGGFGMMEALRKDPQTRDIPVVMLTSKRESRNIFTAQDLGAVDYLMKPVSSDELLDTVAKYVI